MNTLRGFGTLQGALFASDMCDIGLLRSFGTARDLTDAAAQACGAGMDQELCNPTDGRGQAFTSLAVAVSSGALDAAALDRAAANVLRSKFAAGLFDAPVQEDVFCTDAAGGRRPGAAAVRSDGCGGNFLTLPLLLSSRLGAQWTIVHPSKTFEFN